MIMQHWTYLRSRIVVHATEVRGAANINSSPSGISTITQMLISGCKPNLPNLHQCRMQIPPTIAITIFFAIICQYCEGVNCEEITSGSGSAISHRALGVHWVVPGPDQGDSEHRTPMKQSPFSH